MTKMIKKICFFFLCTLFVILTANAVPAPSDLQKILDKGVLRVAVPQVNNYLPFFAINKQGKLYGFDIDLARSIAKNLGVKLEFYRGESSFDATVQAVAQGKADVAICNLSLTLSRGKFVAYSHPYVTMHLALLINRLWLAHHEQSKHWSSPVAIFKQSAATIGVMAGTSYVGDAERLFPKDKIKTFATMSEMLTAVLKGKIGAIFHDEVQIKKFFLENPDAGLYLKAVVLRDHPDLVGMVVPFDHSALLRWLNLYLQLKQVNVDADYVLKRAYSKRGG